MPREVKLRTGHYYYRFIDTVYHNVALGKVGDLAYFGRWWIDAQTIHACRQFALNGGYALSEAAKYFFALPYEWGDHRRLVKALLTETLRAWEGMGAPAQSGNRHPQDRETKWIPPQHVQIHQLFVPGTAEEIRSAFTLFKCEYADKAAFW